MAIDPDLTELRKQIDQLLAERRPDRYTVRITDEGESDDSGTEWLDDIATDVAELVPDQMVRDLFARTLVGKRESIATRAGNRFMRKVAETGQLPLDWSICGDEPVAVLTRDVESGEMVLREERVALRAMTAKDFRSFSIEERRRAASDFTARNSACEGADWIADHMTVTGAATFAEWAKTQEADS